MTKIMGDVPLNVTVSSGTIDEVTNVVGGNISVDNILIDDKTTATATIEFEHHKVHEGDSFVNDSVDISMTTNDTLVLAFKTPDTTKLAHMVVSGWSLTIAHIDIIEGPTWDSGSGSQNTTFNRDRNSTTTSTLLEDTTGSFAANSATVLNPTNLAGGTIIHDIYFAAGKKEGGEIPRGIAEFMLKRNTTYAIRMTADAVNSAGHLILNWYEQIPVA